MTPEDILWEDAKYSLFCTREEFDEALKQCEVRAVPNGAILIQGAEIHCAGNKAGWLTRKVIRDHLVPLINKHGYAVTHIPKREDTGRALAERLGFTKVGETDLDDIYRIERARHG